MRVQISAENLSKLAKPNKHVRVFSRPESMRFDCNGFFFPGTEIKNIKKSETLSCLGLSPGLFLSLQSSTFLGCSELLWMPPRAVTDAFSWTLYKTLKESFLEINFLYQKQNKSLSYTHVREEGIVVWKLESPFCTPCFFNFNQHISISTAARQHQADFIILSTKVYFTCLRSVTTCPSVSKGSKINILLF